PGAPGSTADPPPQSLRLRLPEPLCRRTFSSPSVPLLLGLLLLGLLPGDHLLHDLAPDRDAGFGHVQVDDVHALVAGVPFDPLLRDVSHVAFGDAVDSRYRFGRPRK